MTVNTPSLLDTDNNNQSLRWYKDDQFVSDKSGEWTGGT